MSRRPHCCGWWLAGSWDTQTWRLGRSVCSRYFRFSQPSLGTNKTDTAIESDPVHRSRTCLAESWKIMSRRPHSRGWWSRYSGFSHTSWDAWSSQMLSLSSVTLGVPVSHGCLALAVSESSTFTTAVSIRLSDSVLVYKKR